MNVSFSSMLICIVEMNNMGVTGQFLPPKNDFEHARGPPRNSAFAFWTRQMTDRHISRKISIEHPSDGVASLAQLKGTET